MGQIPSSQFAHANQPNCVLFSPLEWSLVGLPHDMIPTPPGTIYQEANSDGRCTQRANAMTAGTLQVGHSEIARLHLKGEIIQKMVDQERRNPWIAIRRP